MWKHLVITLNFLASKLAIAQVCPVLTDDLYGNIAPDRVIDFLETSLGEHRITRVKAWWTEDEGSETWGELKAIEIRTEEVDTGKVSFWSTHVPDSFRNGEGEEYIPEGRTVIAWEQSAHSNKKGFLYATGFKIHLDDGSYRLLGHFWTSYGKQWIRGPLRGV